MSAAAGGWLLLLLHVFTAAHCFCTCCSCSFFWLSYPLLLLPVLVPCPLCCCSSVCCLPRPGKTRNVNADEGDGGISNRLRHVASAAMAQGRSNERSHHNLTQCQLNSSLDEQELPTKPAQRTAGDIARSANSITTQYLGPWFPSVIGLEGSSPSTLLILSFCHSVIGLEGSSPSTLLVLYTKLRCLLHGCTPAASNCL
jgi:hypothetical protein